MPAEQGNISYYPGVPSLLEASHARQAELTYRQTAEAMNCMSLIGSSARATQCPSSSTADALEDDDVAVSPTKSMTKFLGAPLMVEAASKVDKCLARLQNLQGTVTVPAAAPVSGSASACMSPNFSRSRSCLHGSPSVKEDDKIRIHDVLRWSDDFSGKFKQERKEKYVKRLSRSKTEVFDEKKDPLDPHGEWKHWSSPAGDVHKVISEILMASQIAKQITSMVNAALAQPDVSSDDGRTDTTAAAAPTSQSKRSAREKNNTTPSSTSTHQQQLANQHYRLQNSRRKDDPLHKFRVVVGAEGPVKKRSSTAGSKKEVLYPKSKQPVPDRARPTDENQILSSTAKKMQSRRSPRGASASGPESRPRATGVWAAKEITNRKSPSQAVPSSYERKKQQQNTAANEQLNTTLRRVKSSRSPPWNIVEKPKLATPSSSEGVKPSYIVRQEETLDEEEEFGNLVATTHTRSTSSSASDSAIRSKEAVAFEDESNLISASEAADPLPKKVKRENRGVRVHGLPESYGCPTIAAPSATAAAKSTESRNGERIIKVPDTATEDGIRDSIHSASAESGTTQVRRSPGTSMEQISAIDEFAANHDALPPSGTQTPGTRVPCSSSRDSSPQRHHTPLPAGHAKQQQSQPQSQPQSQSRSGRPSPLIGSLRHKFVMEATEIKGPNKPWRLNQPKSSKAVLFSNPAFAPASPPGARPPPDMATVTSTATATATATASASIAAVASSSPSAEAAPHSHHDHHHHYHRNGGGSPLRSSSATRRVMHRIGRAISARGRSMSPDITHRLSSTRQKIISLSPGKSLPSLISKLPSRGRKSSSAPRATTSGTDTTSIPLSYTRPAPSSGDLPLPPGRKVFAVRYPGTTTATAAAQEPLKTVGGGRSGELCTAAAPPPSSAAATTDSLQGIARRYTDQDDLKFRTYSKGTPLPALKFKESTNGTSAGKIKAHKGSARKSKSFDSKPHETTGSGGGFSGGLKKGRHHLVKSRSESHWNSHHNHPPGVVGVLSSCRRWVEESAPPAPGGVAFQQKSISESGDAAGSVAGRAQKENVIPGWDDEAGGVLGLLSSCRRGLEDDIRPSLAGGSSSSIPGDLNRSWSAGSRSFSTGKIRPGSSLLRRARDWVRTQTPYRDRPRQPEAM